MDPAIIDLTMKVMAVLSPFVAKGAEEFASKISDTAYEKAAALLSTLKKKWAHDPVATADLTRFEKKPETYKEALKETLQEKLSEDKELTTMLSDLLQDMGPALEIFQQMEKAEGITGLESDEMLEGNVKVTQHITDAKNTTGAKIKRIGRA